MAMTQWDPALYERFKSSRDRPALDLLVRLPQDHDPREIWDLGCGTGEHAALLKRRHPVAEVHGLDSSEDMLSEARRREVAVDWSQADIADFRPGTPPDLIFTNAALHWLPDHDQLFPRLLRTLAADGVFACQMPQSFDTSWHLALRQTAEDGPWAARLSTVQGVRRTAPPAQYHDWIAPLCGEADIWSTTYLHVLEGEDPVVQWMMGTGLRPYVQALGSADERLAFLEVYRARLADMFPVRADGTTLFPFPRLFIVARR